LRPAAVSARAVVGVRGLAADASTLEAGACAAEVDESASGCGAGRGWTPSAANRCCGWRARTRAGVACGSRVSCASSASGSVRPRSARSFGGVGRSRPRGEPARPGRSSSVRGRKGCWAGTASPSRLSDCGRCACWSGSSGARGASTSPRDREAGLRLADAAAAEPGHRRAARGTCGS
jgi:hypothetical protein